MRNLPERRSKFSSIYTKALDILKHEGHEEARDCRACSLISLSLCPSSTALHSSTILSRALTPSRSFVLSLCPSSLSLSLSECSGTHTHSLVHVSLVRTRVVFGVEDTQESSNTNIRSIARVPRGPRYFMSPATRAFLYIVMLLACHASIERQKQTGSETGGWIVRL